ncbi:MAG: helix-turn-helix domain-containing protein [Gammaproteobacteria bacterium]
MRSVLVQIVVELVRSRRHIELGIAACDGNLSKAAVLFGVNPSTIYRKRRSWPSDS